MFDHMREAVETRGEKYISFLYFPSAELLVVPLQPVMILNIYGDVLYFLYRESSVGLICFSLEPMWD